MERLVFNDALEPFYCVNNVISGEDEFKVEQRFNPAPYAENVEFVFSSTSKNYMVVEGSLLSKDGTILYAHPSAPADGVFRVLDSVKILGWWCMFSNEASPISSFLRGFSVSRTTLWRTRASTNSSCPTP